MSTAIVTEAQSRSLPALDRAALIAVLLTPLLLLHAHGFAEAAIAVTDACFLARSAIARDWTWLRAVVAAGRPGVVGLAGSVFAARAVARPWRGRRRLAGAGRGHAAVPGVRRGTGARGSARRRGPPLDVRHRRRRCRLYRIADAGSVRCRLQPVWRAARPGRRTDRPVRQAARRAAAVAHPVPRTHPARRGVAGTPGSRREAGRVRTAACRRCS